MSNPETPAGPAPKDVAKAQAVLDQHAASVDQARAVVEHQKAVEVVAASQVGLEAVSAFLAASSPAVAAIRDAASALIHALPPSTFLSVIGQQVAGLDGLATMAGHLEATLKADLAAAEKTVAALDA